MTYRHLEALKLEVLKRRFGESPHLSIRQVAQKMGIGFSTLAKILREEGQPSPHTDLAIQRWLYPESTIPVCVCSRCLQPEVSFNERVEALERAVLGLRERVEALESIFYASNRSLSPRGEV